MMPVLQIGPLAINFPIVILLGGLWFGFRMVEKRYQTEGVAPDKLIDGLITILIGMVIGARVAYLIRYPEIFLAAPAGIFSISTELLDPLGALVVAIVMVIRFVQREKISFWRFVEAILPFVFTMAITFSLMSFAGLEGYGTQTTMPWALNQAGAMRHPYQLYFVGLMALTFWGYDFLKKKAVGNQQLIGLSLFALGVSLTFAFGFQADGTILFAGIRQVQIIGFLTMGVGVWRFVQS